MKRCVCGKPVLNTSCCSEMLKISIGSVNWHLENNELNLLGVYKRLLVFPSPSICRCMIALHLHIRLHTLFPPAVAG